MTGSNSTSDSGRRVRWIRLAGIAAAILGAALNLAAGDRLDRPLFDWWQRESPRSLAGTKVAVVLIDSDSLAAVGPWPWPRYHMARLTEEIAARHAVAIGFDMLFPEPDRVRPDIFAGLYPELSPAAAAEIVKLPPMDRLFGQVIGRAPVVLGRAAVDKDGASAGQLPVDIVWRGTPPPGIRSYPGAIANIPELELAALGHGLLNGQPDSDGKVRHVPMLLTVGARPMPGFGLELARNALGIDTVDIGPHALMLGKRRVSIDGEGRMTLHFGDFPAANIVSAADVLRQNFPKNAFAGKVVLIGMAAEGTADIVATPLAPETFGTLVQAQVVDTLLRGGALARPVWAWAAEWGAGFVLAWAIILFVPTGRRRRVFAPVTLAAVIPVATWSAFMVAGLLVDPLRPLILGGAAALGVGMAMALDARRERERLREALVRERIDAAATEGELQAARTIQLEMLPSRASLAKLDPRVDIDAVLEPAKSVGGDFFDIVRLGDDRLAFVIADVTGKGVPAALFMALSKALTKSVMLRDSTDLGNAAMILNEELSRDNGDTMGVTMLIGLLDLASGAVAMVSAGHEDPLHMRANGVVVTHKLEGGPPFCVVDYPYPVETMTLAPGETLVLITDGVTEAQDGQRALFGNDRVRVAVCGSDATEIVDGLRDAVRTFEAGADASDDLTVMAVRYLG